MWGLVKALLTESGGDHFSSRHGIAMLIYKRANSRVSRLLHPTSLHPTSLLSLIPRDGFRLQAR